MAKIINLTPHPIHLLDEENQVLRTFESKGLVRLKACTVDTGFTVEGCRITETQFGEPEGLPEKQVQEICCACSQPTGCSHMEPDGSWVSECCGAQTRLVVETYYIVSQLVKSALLDRIDLLVPAEVQRNEAGNIVGCKSFGI